MRKMAGALHNTAQLVGVESTGQAAVLPRIPRKAWIMGVYHRRVLCGKIKALEARGDVTSL